MTNKEILLIMKLRDEVSKQITTVQGRMQKFTRSFKENWLAAAAAIFLVQRAIKGLVDPAIEFESAFAGVRKTVNATEQEFKKLEAGILQMSRDIPIAATELAKIQELAGQLGVSGVKNLTKFTETVAKIGVTTNLTTESAATSFARIANIMKLPLDQVDRMASSVVELGNNSATMESEIIEFANRIAGAGAVAGLSTADILGFGAAFSSVGVSAERGGTAVNKTLLDMAMAVEKGGVQLQTFAQVSGQTSEEFARGFKENAGRQFALFIEGLGRQGVKGAQTLERLGLADQRLIQSFLSVGGATGILTKSIDLSNEAWQKNLALNEEAAKRFDTTASRIQLMQNNINLLQIEIGTKLLPVFEKLLELTKKYVDFATGEDLTLNKMQILEKSLKEIDERIRNLRAAAMEFGDATDVLLKINDLERHRSVLVGFIHQEKQMLAETEAQMSDATLQNIEEERQMRQELHDANVQMINEEFQQMIDKETQKIESLRSMWQAWQDEKTSGQLVALQQEEEKLNFFIDVQKRAHESLWAVAGKARDTFSSGVSNMFGQMLKGTLDAKKAFIDLGLQMVQILIDFAVQKLVNSVLSLKMMATEVAAQVAAGVAVAAAWAPAAANVSLASFGSNAVPASAGIAQTHALTRALSIPGLQGGGDVLQRGSVLVGERGPEILNLPRGARVAPLTNTASGGSRIEVNVEINNPVVTGDEMAEEFGNMIAAKVATAINNEAERI
jgi:TP901 family phage tail tape measure protein